MTRRRQAGRTPGKAGRAARTPIKAIIFDLDGTLVDDAAFSRLFWFEEVPRLYAERHGVPLEEATLAVISAYKETGPLHPDWYRPHFWFEKFRLEEDWRKVIHDLRHHLSIFPDVKPALEALHRKHRLIVLTHSTRELILLKLEAESVRGFFDDVLSAIDDFRAVKSKELFALLLDRLSCRQEEVLHVGDHPGFDHDVPRSLGIRAILLDRTGRRRGKDVIRSLEELPKVLGEAGAARGARRPSAGRGARR